MGHIKRFTFYKSQILAIDQAVRLRQFHCTRVFASLIYFKWKSSQRRKLSVVISANYLVPELAPWRKTSQIQKQSVNWKHIMFWLCFQFKFDWMSIIRGLHIRKYKVKPSSVFCPDGSHVHHRKGECLSITPRNVIHVPTEVSLNVAPRSIFTFRPVTEWGN